MSFYLARIIAILTWFLGFRITYLAFYFSLLRTEGSEQWELCLPELALFYHFPMIRHINISTGLQCTDQLSITIVISYQFCQQCAASIDKYKLDLYCPGSASCQPSQLYLFLFKKYYSQPMANRDGSFARHHQKQCTVIKHLGGRWSREGTLDLSCVFISSKYSKNWNCIFYKYLLPPLKE